MNKMRIHTYSSYLVVSGCISLHLTNSDYSDYSDYHHLHMQHNATQRWLTISETASNRVLCGTGVRPVGHSLMTRTPHYYRYKVWIDSSLISGHVQIMYIFYIFYIFYMCSFIVRTSSDCSVSSACSIHVASNFGQLVPHLKEQTAKRLTLKHDSCSHIVI